MSEQRVVLAAATAAVEEDQGGYAVTASDEAGFPIGLLYPDGHMLPVAASAVGTLRVVPEEHGRPGLVDVMEVVWDGSKPAVVGRTKGELLGTYITTGDLWRRIANGAQGKLTRVRRKQRLDEQNDGENR